MPEKKTVGVIDSDTELVSLMELCIEDLDFQMVNERLADIEAEPQRYVDFLYKNDPSLLIVDVPHPYEANWEAVRNLISLKESQGRKFILTTTNKPLIDKLINDKHLEVVGEPFDLEVFNQTILTSLSVR